MTCSDVLDSLSDYLDDDLDEESADEIDIHLGSCHSCQAFLNTFQRTVEFCKDTIVPPLPEEEKSSIRDAIRSARKGSGKKKKKAEK